MGPKKSVFMASNWQYARHNSYFSITFLGSVSLRHRHFQVHGVQIAKTGRLHVNLQHFARRSRTHNWHSSINTGKNFYQISVTQNRGQFCILQNFSNMRRQKVGNLIKEMRAQQTSKLGQLSIFWFFQVGIFGL